MRIPPPDSRRLLRLGIIACCGFIGFSDCAGIRSAMAQSDPAETASRLVRQFCLDCHSGREAEAGIDLQALTAGPTFASDFQDWRKVLTVLESGRMPPVDAEPPGPAQRRELTSSVRTALRRVAELHAGDPGPVLMRRLTSAEYDYSIRDLTGLDIQPARGLIGDAVGGEGFTNTGIAQFLEDATLERYLEAAKEVADHLVIGAGPLRFHQDPGQTGLELSAITRILSIYRKHGFRRAAGEGGEAFGLEKYPQAFYVAWLFRHRELLDLGDSSLNQIAAAEGIDVRFAEYIWSVLTGDVRSFPTRDIISHWQALPTPETDDSDVKQEVRARCEELFDELREWQVRFGINADAKEEAPVLAADSFSVSRVQPFEMNINWPEGTGTAHLELSVDSSNSVGQPDVVVIWKDPRILFRIPDKREKKPGPLRAVLEEAEADRLVFGVHPRGGEIGAEDFVTTGTRATRFRVPIPEGARSARLYVEAELDVVHGDDCIVRCTIAQEEETDQGKSVSALLANPESPDFASWRAGVLEFARLLPQISQREPAPSDRDPIPPPFDATYNNPQRNLFHYRIKYHRDDQFLVDNILDEATRRELDQAWSDLLGSFDYHDSILLFVADKYEVDLGSRRMADLDPQWIEALPAEPREYVQELFLEYHSIQQAFERAEAGHVEDILQLASRAWRRPLSDQQEQRLRSFYRQLRTESALDHRAAIRALCVRMLVAPEFLFRAERSDEAPHEVALSDWELASRLSYFLWSSIPDDELRQVAATGQLSEPAQIAKHARRMLRDERARRLATEFFGQWFGFYQFDHYSGIDAQRFPEFTDALKSAMYDEAILFFDHIVRRDRPLQEILFADYTFLNRQLANYYGIHAGSDLSRDFRRVDGVDRHHRGGLLNLGAVLTATSAPLRTSPVKRGDWVLRRVLGTPVPPPPPDAGSIAPDDQPGDGLSIQQRLQAHRREASCLNCHSRIDPLGFALEHFDAIGRWRDEYRDGTQIDPSGVLSDGTRINGPEELVRYLESQQSLFYQNLCTKLVGYALGRGVLVGDTVLIEQMVADLEQGCGFSQLVERIVTSRQFRYHGRKRVPEAISR